MARLRTLQDLFKRYRRPGDLVFAAAFLAFALFLAANLGTQVAWTSGGKLVAQPAFWPLVSILGMVFFAALHFLGSLCSERIHGRWQEVWFWLRSVEYAAWFMAYVLLVPWLGYLPSTVIFCAALALRAAYPPRMIGWAALSGVAVVVIFKAFLQVRVPGGEVYEYLPAALRSFMLTYL